MNWTDLLRMSSSNLKRRKLRTFLTVLGVIIGTTSIVVMISLGLGLQQSVYEEIEQSGGLNTITVTGSMSDGGMYMDGVESGAGDEKRLTDDVIPRIQELEHVTAVYPVATMDVLLLKGNLEAYVQLAGMTQEGLSNLKIELEPGGKLPEEGTGRLDLLYGNGIITNFSDKNSGYSVYYERGELPDVDLQKDTLFLILDQDSYWNSQAEGGSFGMEGTEEEGQTASKPVQKHAVVASGLEAGGPETYTMNSYMAYCDLDTLKAILNKEFAGRAIPGQPTTPSGKPYKDFTYSSFTVKVDDIDSVDETANLIRQMGYSAVTNVEYMESAKSQMAMIQAALGGIGAISLLVAAIGIANTMMMSIYERTKEIGVIKVLGCSLKNIKQMFLLEAAAIGLIGGIVGCVLSYGISFAINMVASGGGEVSAAAAGNISYIPFWLALAATGFAVFIGMAAGYFPALRAMRLSPLAAIRNE